jgi:hypothetical protein
VSPYSRVQTRRRFLRRSCAHGSRPIVQDSDVAPLDELPYVGEEQGGGGGLDLGRIVALLDSHGEERRPEEKTGGLLLCSRGKDTGCLSLPKKNNGQLF